MNHGVEAAIDGKSLRHVLINQFEAALTRQMADVGPIPREEVVESDYGVTLGQQPIAHMGADETRRTGNHYSQPFPPA
jgi:hypothetical protein